MMFRKKPVVIDAWKVDDLLNARGTPGADLPIPIIEALHKDKLIFAIGEIYIRTEEGIMKGKRADWIIRGVEGELYPCKPEIFEKTYEQAQ